MKLFLLLLMSLTDVALGAEIATVVDSVKRQIEKAEELIAEDLQPSNDLLPKESSSDSLPDEEALLLRAAGSYDFPRFTGTSSSSSSSSSETQQSLELEPIASAANHDDHHDDDHHHHHHHHHHPKIGYSVGGPLVNIAQGAATQAHNFEKNQPAAAAQAEYVAKNRLGQSAGLSAATAAAAFAGKQIIYRGLQQQAYNAHRALESEKLQLQQAQRAATAAGDAAQHAMRQVQVITTALNSAQETSKHASTAAAQAAAELAAQTAMVGAAKARLQAIEEQLALAHVDFKAAQEANTKARLAAQQAQSNAAAAAVHAEEVANANHDHHHHHHHHHNHNHHRHHEHHSGKLESLNDDEEEAEDNDGDDKDDDHDHRESIAVSVSEAPVLSSSTNNTARELNSATSGYPVTLSSINKDEQYDAYDSFPY